MSMTYLTQMMLAAAEPAGAAGAAGAAPGARPASGMDFLMQFAPIILIVIVFFWLMRRSEKKKQKKRQDMIDAIKPRDRVVTIGGIHGRVVNVKDDVTIIRVDDDKDVKITINKSAVSRSLEEGDNGALEP